MKEDIKYSKGFLESGTYGRQIGLRAGVLVWETEWPWPACAAQIWELFKLYPRNSAWCHTEALPPNVDNSL